MGFITFCYFRATIGHYQALLSLNVAPHYKYGSIPNIAFPSIHGLPWQGALLVISTKAKDKSLIQGFNDVVLVLKPLDLEAGADTAGRSHVFQGAIHIVRGPLEKFAHI